MPHSMLYESVYRALANLEPGETMARRRVHELRCGYMGQGDTSHGTAATNTALHVITTRSDSVYEMVTVDGVMHVRRIK